MYCDGELLLNVQTEQVFNDSKEFVDMPMKADPGVFKIIKLYSLMGVQICPIILGFIITPESKASKCCNKLYKQFNS